MRQIPHAAELDPVVPLVLEAAGLPRTGAIVRERAGIGNHVYRIGRDYIVRLGTGSDGREFSKSCELLTVLQGRVRCPRLLYSDLDCVQFEWPVMVCAYVHGRTLQTLWAGLTESERRSVFAQILDEVRAIHAFHWQELNTLSMEEEWAASRRRRVETLIDMAQSDAALDQKLVANYAEFWRANHGALDGAEAPVLIHNDVHVGNAIVDEGLRLQALLDFDDAEIAPSEIEFWNITDELLDQEGGPGLPEIREMLSAVHRFGGDAERTRCLLNETYWQLVLLTEGVSWRSKASCRAGAAATWQSAFVEGCYDAWFN